MTLFVAAGYLFGNIPFVAHNLEYLVIGIIAFSLVPALWQLIRSWPSRYGDTRGSRHQAERPHLLGDSEEL